MKAAVLRSLGKPPRFEEFPDPKPSQGEVIVHIKAASLKNIDKMMASGSHYDSHRELPVVCGTDGVGILSAAALRNSGLELYGGGGGSIPPKVIFDAFPQIWALAASGKLRIDIEQAPLANVETAWRREDLPGRRLVVVP